MEVNLIRKYTHIGAYAIIYNDDKILLIRKSRGAYTGRLDLPGGKIEHGETPVEAVKREIEEETDLIISDFKLIDVSSIRIIWNDIDEEEDLHHLGILFITTTDINNEIKEESDGLDSLGATWCNINQLSEENVSPFAYKAINILKNGINID